jgi:hypothetical protein
MRYLRDIVDKELFIDRLGQDNTDNPAAPQGAK